MATKNIRTVVFLPAQLREALERLSNKTGAPLGELIRRALTMYLKREKA
jgi:metal-responsive CopG/Arc/MetJ family transcriptional regulator